MWPPLKGGGGYWWMERVKDGGLRTIFGGEDNHDGGSRRWKIRMTDGGEGNGREG